jgi:diaminohydroxyphosphoribosylaminopyrimidine deaminase / 5-amino-6-(5-phosphoribosylamino)uracil reductase
MVIDDAFFMRLAVDEAWHFQILTYPNPAVGCCIVGSQNELLSVEAHQRAGGPHAEVFALQKAYEKLTGDTTIASLDDADAIHTYLLENHNRCFEEVTLFVTLEPCAHRGKTPSCAALIAALGVKRVVIACADKSKKARGGAKILEDAAIKVDFFPFHVKADALLFPFTRWSREGFVFFKWAQRLDGSIQGGTISSLESRTLVHKMRSVCDLLVIGGETVRTDRPTLDARLSGGKAPDVLIVSRQKEFDETIPLFSVPNRRVKISENFELLKEYRCVMVEGGTNMLDLSKKHVDYYLGFIAPKSGGEDSFCVTKEEFEILHTAQTGEDIALWMRLKG